MNPGAIPTCKDSPRAEAQRERILCAAQKCFIEHGFHAASMANIADTAQMSAGLMYRYFENKNAIVLAIVQRQLGEGRAHIARLHSSADLAADILQAFTRWQARDQGFMNPALFLEIRAEASREPQIAAALRTSDELISSDLQAWMTRSREHGGLGLTPETAALRTFLLLAFVDGLAVRAIGDPGLDAASIRDAVEKFTERLVLP